MGKRLVQLTLQPVGLTQVGVSSNPHIEVFIEKQIGKFALYIYIYRPFFFLCLKSVNN